MSVRAWFTISALVLVALAAAVAFQFLRPVEPPAIVLHAGGKRIEGAFAAACWPQRGSVLRCTRGKDAPRAQTIQSHGTLRTVLLLPARPKEGSIRIANETGEPVLRSRWKRTLRYSLKPGMYRMTAQAGSSKKGSAYVRYVFALRVTRSGA